MTDDAQLLRQYAEERAEPAFGELMARHIDLVYSAALRVAGGDRQLAQDAPRPPANFWQPSGLRRS